MAQSHYHKIRRIFNKTIDNENNINKLESTKINSLAINYNKKQREYTTDWILLSSTNKYIMIELINFPEEFIANLKIISIFKTTDGWIENTNYLNFIPTWHYIIRERTNKYIVEIFVNVSSIPTTLGIYFKTNICSTNLGDCDEVRARKK